MSEPKLVLLYLNPDDIVDTVIRHPLVMVASDGHIERGKGHPRGSGTYARVLSRYVRSTQALTLMDAVRKMALMPAQRLERATPAARRKGRIQEGADADVVVFDAQTIADRATYDKPAEPSVGVVPPRRRNGGRRSGCRRAQCSAWPSAASRPLGGS